MPRWHARTRTQQRLSGDDFVVVLRRPELEFSVRSNVEVDLGVVLELLELTPPDLLTSQAAERSYSTQDVRRVAYSGKAKTISPEDAIRLREAELTSARVVANQATESRESDNSMGMVFVSGSTFNEYDITYSNPVVEDFSSLAHSSGNVFGDGGAGEAATSPYNLSDNIDTRSRLYGINAQVTALEHRPMVSVGYGSGVMWGARHYATAAHAFFSCPLPLGSGCSVIANQTYRVGRNGTSQLRTTTPTNWWIRDAAYDDVPEGSAERRARDIAFAITTDRVGDTSGWFVASAYAESNLVSVGAQLRNAGYPGCGGTESPANCQANHLYGDNNNCARGSYFSKDSDGWNRGVNHSCDTNGGQSGSPLYFVSGGVRRLWGIHNGANGNGQTPNTAARLTPQRIGWMQSLVNNYP